MTLNIPIILSAYLFYNQEISLIILLDIDLKKPISHCLRLLSISNYQTSQLRLMMRRNRQRSILRVLKDQIY